MNHQFKEEEVFLTRDGRDGPRQRVVSCLLCGRRITTRSNPLREYDGSYRTDKNFGMTFSQLKSMLDAVNCEEAQAADVVES
jgi:hypothetical protein